MIWEGDGDAEGCGMLLYDEKQLTIGCSFQICYWELSQNEASFQRVASSSCPEEGVS